MSEAIILAIISAIGVLGAEWLRRIDKNRRERLELLEEEVKVIKADARAREKELLERIDELEDTVKHWMDKYLQLLEERLPDES